MTVLGKLIHSIIGWDRSTPANKIWSYIKDHISKDALAEVPVEFVLSKRTRKITFYYYACSGKMYYTVNITYRKDINKVTFIFSYEDKEDGRIVPILTYSSCDRKTNVRAIKVVGYTDNLAVLDNFFVDINCNEFIDFLCSDEVCRSEGKFRDISFTNIPNELIK